jgi:hypothetical protein
MPDAELAQHFTRSKLKKILKLKEIGRKHFYWLKTFIYFLQILYVQMIR